MPWQGSAPNETFQRTDGTRTGTTVWNQADNAGVKVISVDHDTHDQDIADGLNECLKRDGGNQPTANIPMGGFGFTNLAAAAALTSPVTAGQVGASDHNWYGDLAGTDTYTVGAITGFTPATYETGMKVRCRVVNENATTTPTLNVNSLGAKAIVLLDGSAPSPGDLPADSVAEFVYDGTDFRLIRSSTDFEIADAGTNTQVFPLTLKHSTSGTAAASFGVGYDSVLESDTGVSRVAYQSFVFWVDPTNTSEDSRYRLQVMEAGTLRNAFEVTQFGDITAYGRTLLLNNDQANLDSRIQAYDFTNAAVRDLKWDVGNDRWEFEDDTGTFHPLLKVSDTVQYTEWDKGALAASTTYTQAHGLGAYPKKIIGYLECTTAEVGYSIGDRIAVDGAQADAGGNGFVVLANTTNIIARSPSATIRVPRLDAAGTTGLTAANWKVILAMLD